MRITLKIYYQTLNKNLQRYAYSPLVDGESEDEEEDLLPKTTTKTKLTENIKKRGDKGGYEKVDQDEKMVNKKYTGEAGYKTVLLMC